VSAIEEIKARLGRVPDVRFTESSTSIDVQPRDEAGFHVGLVLEDDGFVVYFDGWHERFDSEEEALDCFAFGLSDACRLCVVYRGSTPTKWIVESQEDGAWVQDSETGLMLVPFWRARRIVHKQNRFVIGARDLAAHERTPSRSGAW